MKIVMLVLTGLLGSSINFVGQSSNQLDTPRRGVRPVFRVQATIQTG